MGGWLRPHRFDYENLINQYTKNNLLQEMDVVMLVL